MKGALLAVFGVLALLVASRSDAQVTLPIAVQVGGGAAVPLGDFAEVAGTGTGVSLGTAFPLAPNVGVYGGYTWMRFDSDAFGGDLTDSGLSAGLSLALPLTGRVSPWVGGGIVLHSLEIAGAAQQPGRSGTGFGLGSGVSVVLSRRVRISPSVGYLQYSSPIPQRGVLTVSYLSAGLAVTLAPS